MILNQRSSYGFIHVFIPVALARVLPGIKIGLNLCSTSSTSTSTRRRRNANKSKTVRDRQKVSTDD